jgi:SPP1 gp7 family putative phage head morphogenesis protein
VRSLWEHRNLDLITSLPAEHIDRVRDVLAEHRGARVEELAERIEGATGASEAQARLIARDQVLKLNAQVAQARHQAAGVTEYVWRSSRDERVRSRHKVLDGTRQKYAHPPIVDPGTGRRGHPGEDYQCRCTADPVLPGLGD